MPFTAVVVLHESEAELRVLLDSVDAWLPDRPQIVVVDSGSSDGGAGLARSRGAEVVMRDGNPGFGAACNAGVARAECDVTVLLNPDCELLDDSLARLAAIARSSQDALHAPRLLNADGSVQRSAHPLPGTVGAMAGALVHAPLLPVALRDRLEPHRAETPRSVGWAIAACLAAPTALLRRLGPFDPAVHLFGEDLELCLRARAQGVPTVLHPQLRIRHSGGHSTLRDGEPLDLLARRRREAIAAVLGPGAVRADDLAQALTFAGRAVGHAVLGGDSRRPRAQLGALRRARREPARLEPPRHEAAVRGARLEPPRHEGARPALLVSFTPLLGGAERVLVDWGSALARPVLLACPPGPLAEAALAAGFDVVALPERPLRLRGARVAAARALATFARDMSALVQRRRPRVVIASGARPVLAAALARPHVPVLGLHHDLPAGPALARALRWASRRCDAAVAVSAAVGDAVDPRAQVIHPGVDLSRWRATPLPDEPRALVLGALVPWKRADLALEVAARLPDLHLELVGEPLPGDPPDFADRLRARAAARDLAGRVTFTGALADPRPALARARLLLHCADREPFGLALVEALAAGRPVVAPDAAGPAEILAGTRRPGGEPGPADPADPEGEPGRADPADPEGEPGRADPAGSAIAGGLLYPPGDPGAAARAVAAVLADDGAGAAARARAEAAFDGAAAGRRFAAAVEALEPVRLAAPVPAGVP
jgi:N-acetylglucosaminyl-diphospho-decaprenol L-rhamnosyltransferase